MEEGAARVDEEGKLQRSGKKERVREKEGGEGGRLGAGGGSKRIEDRKM